MATHSSKSSTSVIDENGDAILILKNPIEELRDWIYETSTDTSSDTPTSDSENDPTGDIGGRSDKLSKSTLDITQATREVRFQVSSTLLRNASAYFRNMFSGGFNETTVNAEDGKYHITVQGLHPKALEHVMNIIHVKTKRVPRQVTLELLVHITVLINYYNMEDAVAFHAEVWAKAVARKKFPDTYCKELLLRTFIARTFGDKRNYQRGAHVIVMECKGPCQDLGLPMFGLTDMLDERRNEVIQTMVAQLKRLPKDIEDGKWGCDDACKSMLLGHFIMNCCAIQFSGQRLEAIYRSFYGVSIIGLRLQLRLCAVPPVWSRYEGPESKAREHACSLAKFVDTVVFAGQGALDNDFEA